MTDSDTQQSSRGGDQYHSGWAIDANDSSNRPGIVVTNNESVYTYDIEGDESTVTSRSTHTAHEGSVSESGGYSGEHGQQQPNAGDREIGNELIGHRSSHWKRAVSCLAFGFVSFLLATLFAVLYTVSFSHIWLYMIGIMTLLYLFLRFGFSYYIYHDAKLLRYHTRNRRVSPGAYSGWEPSPVLWGVFTLILPPFVEYGPGAAYLYIRHKRTGVP